MIQVESGTNTKSKKEGAVFFSKPPLFFRIISGRVLDCLSDRVWFAKQLLIGLKWSHIWERNSSVDMFALGTVQKSASFGFVISKLYVLG